MQENKKLKGGREQGLGGGVMSVSLEAATLSVHFWNKITFPTAETGNSFCGIWEL